MVTENPAFSAVHHPDPANFDGFPVISFGRSLKKYRLAAQRKNIPDA
jgi:hypothetical protein